MRALWPTTSHRLAPGALCRRLLSTRPTSPSDVTRPPSGFVSDAGSVLSAESRARLEGRLSALDATGKAQMALVVLERLGDETASAQDHTQFTAALYDLWGVGQAAAQNGVLLAVFTESRRIEARTGVGARRALSDTWLASMLQQEMAPRLREGDVSGGVEAATECILDRLAQGGEQGEEGSGAAGAPPVTLGALALAAAGLATWEFQVDRRRRRCTSCPADEAVTMERVPSELDGASEPTRLQAASQGLLAPDSRLAALSPCERDERRLGAVVFGLLRCPRCHTERVLAVATGRYQACASCHCRCERSETTTLAGATATGEGRERVETYCEHCGRREAREVAVAREERSAFGSSAGGGGASATFLLQADGWRDTPPSEHLERAVRRGRAAVQSWAR